MVERSSLTNYRMNNITAVDAASTLSGRVCSFVVVSLRIGPRKPMRYESKPRLGVPLPEPLSYRPGSVIIEA
jgi:hypothetical protein